MQSKLVKKLLANVEQYPGHHALCVDNIIYTYQELFLRAKNLAECLIKISDENTVCAILSDKSVLTYQTILATLIAGKSYTVMNADSLLQRHFQIIHQVQPEIICIDSLQDEIIISFLQNVPSTNVIVFREDLYELLKNQLGQHHYFYINPDDGSNDPWNPKVDDNAYAYLMFTSGTTGQPKGIGVRHRQLNAYVDSIHYLFKTKPQDRFLQFSELTFDISVHEIFVAWSSGATLYVFPKNYIFYFKKFIQSHQLTHWMSVPANVTLLDQLNQLEPNGFPSLQKSFFCGEAFTQRQAEKWQMAAPNSSIVNLYGPTEATVAITYFEWREPLNLDVVPIGLPFPEQQCALINSENHLSKPGETGELVLSGTQVTEGYWQNKEKTQERFKYFSWDTKKRLWYCTGDLAKLDPDFGYLYGGRVDDQWKIRGYRVEKLEIENTLKKIFHQDAIAVVPYGHEENQIDGVIAFVCGTVTADMLKKLRCTLPDVMIPKKIISLKNLPLNKHGKIDYSILKNLAIDEV